MAADRWEAGSDFALSLAVGTSEFPWEAHPHSLWSCGRDALRGLYAWGREVHGWRRMLMPSYFCQDVVGSTARSVPVELYSWSPLDAPQQLTTDRGDVVFVPAMFGAAPTVTVVGDGMVVEDHSHDLLAPWAVESAAHYAIGSLRKTLPLPDGGTIWSPIDLPVPGSPQVTASHTEVVLKRLSAMTLKRLYLAGGAILKESYRTIGVEGEREMSSGDLSGISAFSAKRLTSMPIGHWREVRAANLALLRSLLETEEQIHWLDAPFSAIILFDSPDGRDKVRRALIEERIYPSILWPLDRPVVDDIPSEHVELSRRMLSLHVDHRYRGSDIERIAGVLRRALRSR